jgi:hypothetical protein
MGVSGFLEGTRWVFGNLCCFSLRPHDCSKKTYSGVNRYQSGSNDTGNLGEKSFVLCGFGEISKNIYTGIRSSPQGIDPIVQATSIRQAAQNILVYIVYKITIGIVSAVSRLKFA